MISVPGSSPDRATRTRRREPHARRVSSAASGEFQGRRGQAAPSATVAAPATTAGRDSRFLGDSPVNACAARSGTPTGTTGGAGGSDADIWLTVIGGSVLAFMLPPKAPGAWHPTPWRATGHDVAPFPDPRSGCA